MALRLNVGSGERWLRVIAGLILVGGGLYFLPRTLLGYLIAATGMTLLLTGLVRWCPMCYLGGRRLPDNAE